LICLGIVQVEVPSDLKSEKSLRSTGRAESLVSDVLSFYSFDGNDGIDNDVSVGGGVNKVGSRPSLVSSKSNRLGSIGSPQVCYNFLWLREL